MRATGSQPARMHVTARTPDQAHSEMIMHALKKLAQLSAVVATVTVMTASVAAAQGETCGVYKYHDEQTGRCVDARDKPSEKSWADQMLEKKWAP